MAMCGCLTSFGGTDLLKPLFPYPDIRLIGGCFLLPAEKILKKLLNEMWLVKGDTAHWQLQVLVKNSNKLGFVFRDKF